MALRRKAWQPNGIRANGVAGPIGGRRDQTTRAFPFGQGNIDSIPAMRKASAGGQPAMSFDARVSLDPMLSPSLSALPGRAISGGVTRIGPSRPGSIAIWPAGIDPKHAFLVGPGTEAMRQNWTSIAYLCGRRAFALIGN